MGLSLQIMEKVVRDRTPGCRKHAETFPDLRDAAFGLARTSKGPAEENHRIGLELGEPVPLAELPQLCGGCEYRLGVSGRYLGGCTAKYRVRQRWRIPQTPCQGYGLAVAMHGADRIPERPLCGRAKSKCAYCRIVPEIDMAAVHVALFFVERKTRVTMLKRLRGPTAVPLHRPGAVMRLKRDFGVVELGRYPEKISGGVLGLVELATVDVKDR